MYCVKNIKDDLFWVGGSDRRLALFENAYPIPNGISYNSYLLLDEKTVLFDTVDRAITGQFLENVESVLAGRTLDYVIVNHMEPDHCATLGELIRRYPGISVVCNAKTIPIIKQFYEFDIDTRAVIVKENDTFCSGRHTFTFLMAPMVHWPEVMVTYDTTDKILFSADAFGTFGAMNGNLFADELYFERDWLADARRYYTNIVGKYGASVQTLLKKAAALDIEVLSHLIFASATYNGGIFSCMEHLLLDLKAHNLQNRTVALLENGSWGVTAGRKMGEIISEMKNMTILDETITIKSSLKEDQMAELGALANIIVDSMN